MKIAFRGRLAIAISLTRLRLAPNNPIRKISFLLALVPRQISNCLAIALAFGACCVESATASSESLSSGGELQHTNAAPDQSRGSVLAHAWCSTCHLFPEPDLLDKKTWQEQTLPRMKIRLGLSPESIELNKESA